MADIEKVFQGLVCCANMDRCFGKCPYDDEYDDVVDCTSKLAKDALELLKEQQAIIDELLKIGYPHNFQREEPWIVNYMLKITEVVKKAVHLRNGKKDGEQDGY